MRKLQANRTLLIGAAAALVLLGGGGLFLALNGSDAPPAAEGEAATPNFKAFHSWTWRFSVIAWTAKLSAWAFPAGTATSLEKP